jgi:hypothetical protein
MLNGIPYFDFLIILGNGRDFGKLSIREGS